MLKSEDKKACVFHTHMAQLNATCKLATTSVIPCRVKGYSIVLINATEGKVLMRKPLSFLTQIKELRSFSEITYL